jgi:hypothetical protein
MSRPSIREEVTKKVSEYLLVAETQPQEQAQLNTLAVAKLLNFDRKTLTKYGLDRIIVEAAERQKQNNHMSPRATESRSMHDLMRDREEEWRKRCEALVAKCCLAEGNAKRVGLDPLELWKPLTVSDRSAPHTGNRRDRKRK